MNKASKFSDALEHLRLCGMDSGVRFKSYGNQSRTTRGASTGLTQAIEALRKTPGPDANHPINCGSELCVGDDIVFIRKKIELVDIPGGSRYSRSLRGNHTSFDVVAGVVSHFSLGESSGGSMLKLETDNGVEEFSLADVSRVAVWRACWPKEESRDGVLAEMQYQEESRKQEDVMFSPSF